MKIMCLDVSEDSVTAEETRYLQRYGKSDLTLTELWGLMDADWDKVGAGYTMDDQTAVDKFYSLPVWLLNGIFSECDTESIKHRDSIADWVSAHKSNIVVDFGGGGGALARRIAKKCPDSNIVVVEPHTSALARKLASIYPNIFFSADLPNNVDIVIAQDVLEHLTDPLAVFEMLLNVTREQGYVVTANCFYPVIKCHFPSTFHLRYTFKRLASMFSCRFVGVISGASHAQIFQKTSLKKSNIRLIRLFELVSKFLYLPIHLAGNLLGLLMKPRANGQM